MLGQPPTIDCCCQLYARGLENLRMCGACYLCQVCLEDRAVLSGYTIHYNVTELCSELGSCVKIKVAVLGSPSLIVLMVSVDVKHNTELYFINP